MNDPPITTLRNPRWEFLVPVLGLLLLLSLCGSTISISDNSLYKTPTPPPPTAELPPIEQDELGMDIPDMAALTYPTNGLGMALTRWKVEYGVPSEVFSRNEAVYNEGRYFAQFWPRDDYPAWRIERILDAGVNLTAAEARRETRALLPEDAILLKTISVPADGVAEARTLEIYRAPSLFDRYASDYRWGSADTPGLITVEYLAPDNQWSIFSGLDEEP